MAFPKGVVWTVQPFWSHHPRYPLPEVRVAAPCVDGDFRVEACSASAVHSTQISVWLYLQPHHAPHLFAEGPAVWLAIWRNGCCVEEVAECAKVILLFQVRNPPVQSRSPQGYRLLFQYNIFQARLV